jgi:hypothetical protein
MKFGSALGGAAGLLDHHILDLHQPRQVSAFVFIQFLRDGADGLLKNRDLYIFQRVDAAAGLFDLLGQTLGVFSCWASIKRSGSTFPNASAESSSSPEVAAKP